jgi:hypothetical protein
MEEKRNLKNIFALRKGIWKIQKEEGGIEFIISQNFNGAMAKKGDKYWEWECHRNNKEPDSEYLPRQKAGYDEWVEKVKRESNQ